MKLGSQSGQAVVVIAFALIVMLGMIGLTIDGGRAYADERSLQAAAEAGAHAGTYLMEKNWDGSAGTFGALTDAQVRATAQAFAQYNGWNSANGDTFYLDYVKPDRTTHVGTLDNTVRGVMVDLGKPQTATFTRYLGFRLYSDFARATAMFGAALVAGALPIGVGDDCAVGYNVSFDMQPANSSHPFGTCNFGTIVPPGCTVGDNACYTNALTTGMIPPVQLGPSYPANTFDAADLSATTKTALQNRINARPGETCTTFKSPSPRLFWVPVVPGGFGGATITFVRFRAFFLTSVEPHTPSWGFTGCFVKATMSAGTTFDPNAVGTDYGGVLLMKLIPSSGTVTPITVQQTTLTNPATRGVANGATLTVHTNKTGANCTVIVSDLPPAPGQPSVAGGLGPKITDASGNASWTWTVDATAITGLTNVQVTCTYQAELGYLFTTTTII
ncbi:MAG TPA: pilus assembly protein TadG-related protein [Candidatus Dormibacteraeota bacterium]